MFISLEWLRMQNVEDWELLSLNMEYYVMQSQACVLNWNAVSGEESKELTRQIKQQLYALQNNYYKDMYVRQAKWPINATEFFV